MAIQPIVGVQLEKDAAASDKNQHEGWFVVTQALGNQGPSNANLWQAAPTPYNNRLHNAEAGAIKSRKHVGEEHRPDNWSIRGWTKMLPPDFVHKLNAGKAFALVGSGPSCELGYPSWAGMAEAVWKRVVASGKTTHHAAYQKWLQKGEYPELFRQAEIDLGGRFPLVNLVKSLLVANPGRSGVIYDILTKWPFACYLTTNYDDEISAKLTSTGVHFQTIQNTKEGLAQVRAGATQLIVKLHGDFDHADNLVLTSADYSAFATGAEHSYYRDRVRAIFEMFDICIIGHSLSDWDLRLILQIAKNSASPSHPIFMILADVAKADEREFAEKFNIQITSYENADGQHSRLRGILRATDPYVVPRKEHPDRPFPLQSPEDNDSAVALFLYRRLQALKEMDASSAQYLEPLVLQALSNITAPGLSIATIVGRQPIARVVSQEQDITTIVVDALKGLRKKKLVDGKDDAYFLTTQGEQHLQEIATSRSVEEDQAYGQFTLTLRGLNPQLTVAQEQKARSLLRNALVQVFRKRGLSIASAVLTEQPVGGHDLAEIFKGIRDAAIQMDNLDLQNAFLEAGHAFLLKPTPPQRNYLASVSQGYFLYHMIGLDPLCRKVRRELFKTTAWLCDSSVLLPLLAIGSEYQAYAADLFVRLRLLQSNVFTTRQLLQETWEHFFWAKNHIQHHGTMSPEFLAAAMSRPGYKQNLFIDGFIRLSSEGSVQDFEDYEKLVFPNGCSKLQLERDVMGRGIAVIDLQDLEGFDESDSGELAALEGPIRHEREARGTYRTDLQVAAEAEVFQIIQALRSGRCAISGLDQPYHRVYFVSLSRVLNRVSPDQPVISWIPEALYRYVIALPGEETSPQLLQECMLSEYYYAGISVIDKQRYLQFFGPVINAARVEFAEQKQKYLQELEKEQVDLLNDAFENTPDLEKPFFVTQMVWRAAEAAERRAADATKQLSTAQTRVKELEREKAAGFKLREKRQKQAEEGRARNLHDPKTQRKKLHQAKKRARKKKR